MTPEERIARARQDLRALREETERELASCRTRKRGLLNRRIHELRRMLEPSYPYVSQAGQDVLADKLFGARTQGTFADIGGYDGTTGSNTLFFEHRRGWTGFLVEPVPAQREKAERVRRCPCLGYAVAPQDGEAEFIEVTGGFMQMSGLAASYDPALLQRVREDGRHREKIVKVETRTLSRLLTEAGIPHPDFISLDVEGGERAVLETFPFERHRVGLWSIENNTGRPEIAAIMRDAGYVLYDFCGPDELWRRREP